MTMDDPKASLPHNLLNAPPVASVPLLRPAQLYSVASVPPPPVIPGLAPWTPGTQGIYPNFGRTAGQFPVWNVRIKNMRMQDAMFTVSDQISSSAFYVSADVWSRDKESWKLTKIYGAFLDAVNFARQVLFGVHRAPTRCFYELIRENRPCKAYFDLEAEPGSMSSAQGTALCQQVIDEWAARIRERWPQALEQCPNCLQVMILDGSRSIADQWKVSYHLVYPWLTFPCNNAALRTEVTTLASLPQFQYITKDGTSKSFIDSGVYSRNRNFRLAFSHKLSDSSRTPLRLPAGSSLSEFLLSCITRIEPGSWLVPHEALDHGFTSNPPSCTKRPNARLSRPPTLPTAGTGSSYVVDSLQALLRTCGFPDGKFTMRTGDIHTASFLWHGKGWPCLVAKHWRQSNPTHSNNGCIISFDETRAVFVKCLHPMCQMKTPGVGSFIGYVPLCPAAMYVSPNVEGITERAPNSSYKRVTGRKQVSPDGGVASTERVSEAVLDETNSSETLPSAHGNTASSEGTSMDQSSGKCTREQSLRRVYSINQAEQPDSFSAWHVVSGAWGGREGPSPPAADHWAAKVVGAQSFTSTESECPSDPASRASEVESWAKRAIDAPFFEPPPMAVMSTIRDLLEQNNSNFSQECDGALPGWADLSSTQAPADTTTVNDPVPSPLRWAVRPPNTWFDLPLGQRTSIGEDLLESAVQRARLSRDSSEVRSPLDPPDIWSSPFTVAFVSVGFRRLRYSLHGIIDLLEKHRPDILFLGDLGATRTHIGRLRLRIQEAVDDEWILFTDIRDSPGYPVGSGAMVHASAAKFIRKLEVPCPPGMDRDSWNEAVGGRILLLEMVLPDIEGRTWLLGFNQHVAANDRTTARGIVLTTLAHITHQAHERGWRLVLLGDANAAPLGGRWGYSPNSKTRSADQQMNDWVSQHSLREVSSSPLQATWKACLLPKKAVLDRAWVFPADLSTSNLSVHWATAQPVFDHAMISIHLPHTVAGLGFAGACRPLHQPIPEPKCRINMRKFREPAVLAEWSRLLQLSLTGSAVGTRKPPGAAAVESLDGLGPMVGGRSTTVTVDHLGRGADGKDAAAVSSDPNSPIGRDTVMTETCLGVSAGGMVATAAVCDLGPGTRGGVGLEADGNGAAAAEGNPMQPCSSMDGANIPQETDPFQALKYAEMVATQIAQSLAPRRTRRPGEVRRSFGFAGHRRIFREVNLLCAARQFVKKILVRSPEVLDNCHRAMLWSFRMSKLNNLIAKSGHPCPPQLCRPADWYFGIDAQHALGRWMDQAKLALDVRWATVREDYAKAQFANIQQAREKLIRNGGALDKRILQAALGKRQPQVRMWGISGQVALGVRISTPCEQQSEVLGFMKTLPAVAEAVSVEGNDTALQVWFRGPRALGDFIIQWCADASPFSEQSIRTMAPQSTYVAIVPDDILAVQELHMAGEGMDSGSICAGCAKPGVTPIVVSAKNQPHGNPNRAVRFFCHHCCSVHDDVHLAPLPPCPIPWNVFKDMRKIPPGLRPLICGDVDHETLQATVRRMFNGLGVGSDGIPREFYKYGPLVFLELLRAAINAYTRGETPTVGAHEWMGALCTFIPKIPAPWLVTDHRPIASECTKFIIATTIYNNRLKQGSEDYQLLDEAGEGFRKYRSTRRQLSKLRAMLDQLSKNKSQAVILYLDIKNAFNAINHRSIFEILEAYGFHPLDVDLFRRMYKGRFLSIVNTFGESAACFLKRGVFQGEPPSPTIFSLAFDPIHKIIRASGRGCPAPGLKDPSGDSAFADDTCLHTGGVDAVPAMRVLVNVIGPFLKWKGLLINMKKSRISAIDFSSGQVLPTDNITLEGKSFPVLLPTEAHKHLGVRMTLTGDFAAEKSHVREEMQRRLVNLSEDQVLSSPLKELAVQVGVTSVFRYSAGVVPWTGTELDRITNMWIRAYKQAWFKKGARSMDSSPIILARKDGGRACPSAHEICMHEVLATLDQCMTLPGEISCIVLHHLRKECHAHGCAALNQMQLLLRIADHVESGSVLSQLLLRLDEQGIFVSSPWPPHQGQVIMEVLWPQLWQAWREKELAAPFAQRAPLFTDGVAQATWEQAKVCLHALKSLGQHGILAVAALRGQAGQWLAWKEDCLRLCGLSKKEHETLICWLDRAAVFEPSADVDSASQHQQHTVHVDAGRTAELNADSDPRADLPPCLRGCSNALASHDRICLTYQTGPAANSSGPCSVDLSAISDRDLAVSMCRSRAVFSYSLNDFQKRTVECLLPLRSILPSPFQHECILVQDLDAELLRNQFSVFTIHFVRDCMLEGWIETVSSACARPPWLVPKSALQPWFNLSANPSSSAPWTLGTGSIAGQYVLQGVDSFVRSRRGTRIPRLPSFLHPWQLDPPLPDRVRVDLSNHFPQDLPAPKGWQVCKRNARVLITGPRNTAFSLDAAQYGMLIAHHCQGTAPPVSVLESLAASCRSQDQADIDHHIPWSRHLLACLRRVLKVELLVGARAVVYNPHFPHFVSPDAGDSSFGAATQWPVQPALILLDSFSPQDRSSVLERARAHCCAVWILRSDRPSPRAVEDNAILHRLDACLMLLLPARSLLLHDTSCWSEAKWDSVPSRYLTQLWLLRPSSACVHPCPDPESVQNLLGKWDSRRYDFHHCAGSVQTQLLQYRSCQQDAAFFVGGGLFCGSDGSVNRRQEKMGAGSVLTNGDDPTPILQLSSPVGGPLASVRAEAVALLCLLQEILERSMVPSRLTVFIDCLGLLQLLSRWGRADFWPGPQDIIHFDVLLPLLRLLRSWIAEVILVKIKSHSGCYHNDRADECASLGCESDSPQLFPGPQKYGTLQLRIQPTLRQLVSEEKACAALPSDNVPNKKLLQQVLLINTWRAVGGQASTQSL